MVQILEGSTNIISTNPTYTPALGSIACKAKMRNPVGQLYTIVSCIPDGLYRGMSLWELTGSYGTHHV